MGNQLTQDHLEKYIIQQLSNSHIRRTICVVLVEMAADKLNSLLSIYR